MDIKTTNQEDDPAHEKEDHSEALSGRNLRSKRSTGQSFGIISKKASEISEDEHVAQTRDSGDNYVSVKLGVEAAENEMEAQSPAKESEDVDMQR